MYLSMQVVKPINDNITIRKGIMEQHSTIIPATNYIQRYNCVLSTAESSIPMSPDDCLYESFKQFMLNSLIIRFGVNERIVTRRLSDTFNETTGNNVSFNMVFPKLMARFMSDYPIII